MFMSVVVWKLEAAVNALLAACTVCCGRSHDDFFLVTSLSLFSSCLCRDQTLLDLNRNSSPGEMNGTQTGCETLPNAFCPSGCSISRSVSTACCKQPVLSERFEGTVVLPLGCEGRSGTETISAVRFLSPSLHHPCSLSPQPLSSTFVFLS